MRFRDSADCLHWSVPRCLAAFKSAETTGRTRHAQASAEKAAEWLAAMEVGAGAAALGMMDAEKAAAVAAAMGAEQAALYLTALAQGNPQAAAAVLAVRAYLLVLFRR